MTNDDMKKPVVLVIDPNITVSAAIQKILEAASYDVAVVDNLEAAKTGLTSGEFTPAVILSALNPKDTKGLVDYLKEHAIAKIPVIGLTSTSSKRGDDRAAVVAERKALEVAGALTAFPKFRLVEGYDYYDAGTTDAFIRVVSEQVSKIEAEKSVSEVPTAPSTFVRESVIMKKAKILIVEDKAKVRTWLEKNLRKCGHEVISVETIRAAEALLANGDYRPDVILMDAFTGTKKQRHDEGCKAAPFLKAHKNQGIPVIAIGATEKANDEMIRAMQLSREPKGRDKPVIPKQAIHNAIEREPNGGSITKRIVLQVEMAALSPSKSREVA